MELYVSQPRGYPASFPRQLQRIAKLRLAGYLDADSSVWVNTNAMSPVFWIYNGLGSAVYWFDAPTAGAVRITNDRVRWAHSWRAAKDAPMLDLDLTNLGVLSEENTRLTFVVDNDFLAPDASVKIAEGRDSKEMRGGFFEGAFGVSVIDLPRFDRSQLPVPTASRSDYDRSLARYQGVKLLTAGMNVAARNDVVNNTSNYLIDLSDDLLDRLCESVSNFSATSAAISSHLFPDNHVDTASDTDDEHSY